MFVDHALIKTWLVELLKLWKNALSAYQYAHDTQSIHQRLDNREGPATLIWVPIHNGIPCKEAADELANAAATANDTPPRHISIAIAKVLIRRTVTDPSPNRP